MRSATTTAAATTAAATVSPASRPVAPEGTVTAVAARMQGRARRLRTEATAVHPLLAEAYRRRAAELDVEAWLESVWNPMDEEPRRLSVA